MKILIFITSISLRNGGPSRSVPIMAKGLAGQGVDVTLMTFKDEDMNTNVLEESNVRIVALPHKRYESAMREVLVNDRFDVILIQSMWDIPYHKLMVLARKHHIPYIITPRGMLEPWSLEQKKWKKRLALWLYQMKDLNRAACIYTTAKMEAQHVRELGIKVPISVIPNGIETDGYPCRTDISKVKKQVLFLSRIHVKKGIELLIDAWNNLAKESEQFKDWRLVIVGNGKEEYINSLKQKVEDLDLQDCISILPPVFGVSKTELYQESALFCLPSYSENFGMVIAEAMSCGVPVITTTNCPWEVLNETNTGWCIDLTLENLTNTLREAMLLYPDTLFNIGLKASNLIDQHFNYNRVAMKNRQLVEWVMGKCEELQFIFNG